MCGITLKSVALNATVDGRKDDGSCDMAFEADGVGNSTRALNDARQTALNMNLSGMYAGMVMLSVPSQFENRFTIDNIRTGKVIPSDLASLLGP